MTRKIYRTAQGKMVDLGALQLQNENTRAVGNMNVNARGDVLDSQNRPISTRNREVARQYRRQTTNVTNEPVTTKNFNQSRPDVPVAPEDFDDDFDKTALPSAPINTPQTTGLAAAIAKARELRQTPITKPVVNTDNGSIKKI